MFQEIITDVTAQINAYGEYAIEFANDGVFWLAFARFWREDLPSVPKVDWEAAKPH